MCPTYGLGVWGPFIKKGDRLVLSFSSVSLIATLTLALFQSLFIITFWLFQREDRSSLWVVAWLGCSVILSLSRLLQYTSQSESLYVILPRIILTSGYMLVWVGYQFVNAFIWRIPPRWERNLYLAVTVGSIALLWIGELVTTNQLVVRYAAFGEIYTGATAGPLYMLMGLIVLASSILPITYVVRETTIPLRERGTLAAGFVLMIFFCLYDFLAVSFNFKGIRLTDFSYIPLAIAYSVVLISRLADVYRAMHARVNKTAVELSEVNEVLRDEIDRRTDVEEEIQRLYRSAVRQADMLEILNLVGQRLAGTLDPAEIIEQLGQGTGELFRPRNFSVLIYNQEREQLEGNVYLDRGQRKETFHDPRRKGLTGALIAGKKPIVAADYMEECQRRSIEMGGQVAKAWLGVPVLSGDNVLGVITVWDDVSDKQFDPLDVQVLATLAAQAAIAIHNAQLFEALRASENKFATAFRTSPDAVSINRLADMRFIEVNNGFTSLSGYTTDEVIGRTLYDLHLWQTPSSMPPLRTMLRDQGPISNLEITFRTKSGKLLIGLMSATVTQFSGEPCLLSFTRDITALKQGEQEILRKAREADAIAQIGRDISSTLQIDVVLERIAYYAKVLLRADTSAVYLAEPGLRPMHAVVAMGPDAEELKNDPLQLGEGILGNIALQMQGEIVNNTDQDSRSITVIGTQSMIHEHLMGMPVLSKDQLIGLIAVWRLGEGCEFETSDLNFMNSIANQTAIAIQNASLFESTRRRLSEIEAVHTMSTALRSARTLDEAMPIILDQLMSLLNAGGASLEMADAETGEIVTELARGAWEPVTGLRTPPGSGLSGHVIATGQPYVSTDVVADGKAVRPDLFFGTQAVACIPVIAQQQPIGTLWVGRTLPILQEEVSLLSAIGEMVGNAIRRMRLHEQTEDLLDDLQVANRELAEAYDTTLEGWARALELRDKETEGHSRRVTELTLRLARCMGFPESEIPHLRRGVLLHDIGKMGISDQLLKKTGPLTDEEWVEMRKHPVFAYKLLKPIAYLQPALDIPYCHHEHWNGAGYPRGLKGEDIPLPARIFAVVDVFDAISNDRPYHLAWSPEEVIAFLRQKSGSQFDPKVVEVFLQMVQ